MTQNSIEEQIMFIVSHLLSFCFALDLLITMILFVYQSLYCFNSLCRHYIPVLQFIQSNNTFKISCFFFAIWRLFIFVGMFMCDTIENQWSSKVAVQNENDEKKNNAVISNDDQANGMVCINWPHPFFLTFIQCRKVIVKINTYFLPCNARFILFTTILRCKIM